MTLWFQRNKNYLGQEAEGLRARFGGEWFKGGNGAALLAAALAWNGR